MEERHKLKCWNSDCQRQYTLLLQRDVGQAKLIVECPYCGAAGEVDLAKFPRSPNVNIHKGGGESSQEADMPRILPEVLPTTPRKQE